MSTRIPWSRSEADAQRRLRTSLREYLALARAAHSLLEHGFAAVRVAATKPSPIAAQVQARILVRVSNDLRVMEIAASSGYSVEALSLLAGVYELTHAVAYIGEDDSRARAWERHEAETHSYPPRRAAVEATLRATFTASELEPPEVLKRMATGQERLYTIACMAKHGNPKVLRHHGVRVEGEVMKLSHGPFISRASLLQSRFSLFHGARMLIGAIIIFARPRVPPDSALWKPFYKRAGRLAARIARQADA